MGHWCIIVREIYDLFVEVGRICYVDGKLVVIVDIVDHNRVLVTSPGAKRSVVSMSKLTLTKQVISIRRMSKAKAVEAAHGRRGRRDLCQVFAGEEAGQAGSPGRH